MEMLFSCPRCTGAHLASQNRNLIALPKMVDFLINAIFLSPLHWWCPFGVPKSDYLGALPKMVDFLISR